MQTSSREAREDEFWEAFGEPLLALNSRPLNLQAGVFQELLKTASAKPEACKEYWDRFYPLYATRHSSTLPSGVFVPDSQRILQAALSPGCFSCGLLLSCSTSMRKRSPSMNRPRRRSATDGTFVCFANRRCTLGPLSRALASTDRDDSSFGDPSAKTSPSDANRERAGRRDRSRSEARRGWTDTPQLPRNVSRSAARERPRRAFVTSLFHLSIMGSIWGLSLQVHRAMKLTFIHSNRMKN